MTIKHQALAAAAAVLAAGAAQAADFTFSGNIQYNTDVIRIDFTLAADATDVKVWTDGFGNGANFDPITAVWSLPSGDKVGENDDNASIAPGQTYYDSGLTFASLAAGTYAFTIAAYNNFAPGNLFSAFPFDGQPKVAIADWCQPASDNCTNQKGTFYRVHLTGVDDAVQQVPEPGTWALMALGLAGMGALRRRPA